jgi:hypothetical protein
MIRQDLDASIVREQITCAAWRGRVLLQVLQLLQDPLGRQGSNPKIPPPPPQKKITDQNLTLPRSNHRHGFGGHVPIDQIGKGTCGVARVGRLPLLWRGRGGDGVSGGLGHKWEEERSRGKWVGELGGEFCRATDRTWAVRSCILARRQFAWGLRWTRTTGFAFRSFRASFEEKKDTEIIALLPWWVRIWYKNALD